MVLAVTEPVTHGVDTLGNVLNTVAICGGIAVIALIICVSVIVMLHVDKGHSVIPWSHRKRVERAKADREVAELRYNTEIADLKHMALQPVRNRILENIENGDIQPLKELLSGDHREDGDWIRAAAWGDRER